MYQSSERENMSDKKKTYVFRRYYQSILLRMCKYPVLSRKSYFSLNCIYFDCFTCTSPIVKTWISAYSCKI